MSAEIRTGKNIVTDQRILKPVGRRVPSRRSSLEKIHARVGITQPDTRTSSIVPGDEFVLFLNAGRRHKGKPPVLGTGIVLLDQLEEGDAIFSGRIQSPKLGDATQGKEAQQATYHFHPEVVETLNDSTNIPLAARGAANLIASRVFDLDVLLDTELDNPTYNDLQKNAQTIGFHYFHELTLMF